MLHRVTTFAAVTATACLFATAGTAMAAGAIEPMTTVRVANGLARPIGLFHAPGDDTRLYIIQKGGLIRILNRKTGALSTFINLDPVVGGNSSTGDERGLLGMAFHPNFQDNGYFYVNYTNNSSNTVIARYTATNGDTASTGTATTIMAFTQPFSNHNGGWMGFSPNNGYLYISTGDGGSGGDPGNRAQDITNQRHGKILRIDVDGGSPYAIPASNPFVGVTGDDEIWSYGLRNAWRCSFDRQTGDLYLADVGQNAWEEINFERSTSAGRRNYGWRCREGQSNFNFNGTCSIQTLIEPFHVYSPSSGFSITGGYVYRGCAIPSLDGTYFFADYGTARIWSLNAGGTNAGLTVRTAELDPGPGSISNIASFGEDLRGEIYIVEQSGGEIYKIIPVTPTISDADVDCNGVVDFSDLLELLSSWGDCDGCFVDIDGNHQADLQDLLTILSEWG